MRHTPVYVQHWLLHAHTVYALHGDLEWGQHMCMCVHMYIAAGATLIAAARRHIWILSIYAADNVIVGHPSCMPRSKRDQA